MKLGRAIGNLVGISPLFSIIFLYLLVIRVHFNTGNWPLSGGYPDPSDLPYQIHNGIVFILSIFSSTAHLLITILISIIYISFKGKSDDRFVQLCPLFVLSSLVWFAVVVYDPGGFLDWFLD